MYAIRSYYDPGDPAVHIASCFFTMVARIGVGSESESVTIPPLEYIDDPEKKRYANATSSREAYSYNFV